MTDTRDHSLQQSHTTDLFPMAQVTGAQTEPEVFAAWKARGLEPKEVTREELVQSITITHDPLDGELKWESKRLDGLGTLNLIMETARSMFLHFTQGKGRVDLGTGRAGVLVAFEDGRLKVVADPPGNDIAVKKLLAVALVYYIDKGAKRPLDEYAELFE